MHPSRSSTWPGRIPGAVGADLYRYGVKEPSRAVMEKRIQSWGVSAGRKIVVYDQGGDMMATRLFFDLYCHGVPASDLFILDGGLARWRAQGGAVTQEATPPPPAGSFRITQVREEARGRFAEFCAVPGAILMPSSDFYNADKTFKSPDEIRRQLAYQGIRPDQVVHRHCGGGVAASVPWFALQFLAGYPQSRIYLESQREWLQDERVLPYWTYSAPQMRRESAWLDGWNAPMLRAFGVVQLNIVDVRAAEKCAQGHVPFAINVGADIFRSHLGRPEKLAELLGPAGVNPAHEVVIVSERGLTPGAALAYLAFQQLGQKKVSVLMDSVDEWGLRGLPLTQESTAVGAPRTAKDTAKDTAKNITVPASTYDAQPRAGVVISDRQATRGAYPKVFVASGKAAPARTPEGQVVRLPYTELLNADGTPKAAKDLWQLITKSGVPRYAELIVFADDPAEAAVNYDLFKLMGWPDVKVWVN